MSFEVFVRTRQGRPLSEPAASVGRGVVHLNTKARQALGNPDRVLLLRDGKDVAFKPATSKHGHTFAITKGNVACSLFIAEMGLAAGEKLALQLEDGMLRTVGRE